MSLAAGLLLAANLHGQQVAMERPDTEVITRPADFWGLSEVEKQKLHHVRFDVLVYYYDPYWQLVWGECGGNGIFLPVRGESLPIKPGQRVRIEGVVVPARGILRNEVTVTVLEESAMPAPLSTHGRVAESSTLTAQWVSLEGYVCEQSQADANHIVYQVLSEGWMIGTRLLVAETEPVPQLVDCRVRFNGVYIGNTDATTRLDHIDLWVPRASDVLVLGDLAQDSRFKLPRTPLDSLPAPGQKEWVRVVGKVMDFKSGQSITIRDDAGQLTIKTPQPSSIRAGDEVELVGRPAGAGLEETLAEALFRLVSNAATVNGTAAGDNRPRVSLRVVEQITELPLNEVARGYNVMLRSAVTWSDPSVSFFYLQDATGGVCVQRDAGVSPPSIGESVEVRGIITPGRYAPEVRLTGLSRFGRMPPPQAQLITLEQALTGAEEARLVGMRGYVRQVVDEGPWSRLDVTTNSGEYSAYLPADKTVAALGGAIVRIAGVCAAETDSRRRLIGIRMWLANAATVEVEEPPPADPFAAPRYTIAGLSQFTSSRAINRRVTVTGRLVMHVPGGLLLLQDAESGLMVLTRESTALPPGTAVEVSGFPGHDGSRVVLREAMVRVNSGGAELVPFPCRDLKLVKPELDARLVQVRGTLNEVIDQAHGVRLALNEDGAYFDAMLAPKVKWQTPEPGSLLELTGAYLLKFDEYHHPRGFLIQLRSPADVRVIAEPSWWTAGRALAIAGGFCLFTMLGVVWVVQLRRVVSIQTQQIRAQLDKQARMQADLERSSRLDSLGVLAGGIAHDFNNLLTAIMGNLGLMRLEADAMKIVGPLVDDAGNATKRASDITKQLLTFARGGEPVRAAVDMAEVVRESTNFALHGSNVNVDFRFQDGLPAADVDASQIGRVIHNLVLNAVQAMPDGGRIRIELRAEEPRTVDTAALVAGNYLQLTISDDGPGIPPERLPHIFDPYFTTKATGHGLGLATAHSIVRKHNGHVEVESVVGRGTTFRISLPVARSPRTESAFAPVARPSNMRANVLFMDDEEAVRRVAGSILRNAGHSATLVNDGTAAVKAFDRARATSCPFDLIILDLTVPGGMGGREAAAELRRRSPAARIVASSGYSQDAVMARYREYGFNAVLPKPYDPDTLLSLIDQLQMPRA